MIMSIPPQNAMCYILTKFKYECEEVENRLGTFQLQPCPPTLRRLVSVPKKLIFGGTNTFEHIVYIYIIPALDLAQN